MGVAARARDCGDADGFLATVLALAEALEARGEGSISSAHVVSRYAELIAREMVLSEEVVDRVRIGGLLHDVGKVGVPKTVLDKPIRSTTATGRKSAAIRSSRRASSTRTPARIFVGRVPCDDERPDGLGYPRGSAATRFHLKPASWPSPTHMRR